MEFVQPTHKRKKLVDRLAIMPIGFLEDVLIKLSNLVVLMNFIILDMESEKEQNIIIGHPFLVTTKSVVDIEKGSLTLYVVLNK